MIHPTPYAELNGVLAFLVEGAKARLVDNFLGAYLQGSFAVGDATPWSDCDFIVVMHRDLTPAETAPIVELHEQIHALPDAPYWRGNLEGSYVPAAILRRWSTEPRDPPGELGGRDWGDPGTSGSPPKGYPFWYLDHGSKVLVRSEHDNTQVVRWCLREKGITLAGPDPKSLIDPVPPAALKAEVRATLDLVIALNLQPMELVAWQAFWVGLCCRILHTLATGRVHSKKAGYAWALEHLDGRWASLVAEAATLRKGDDTQAAQPADPARIAETHAFAGYAREYADRLS